MGSKTLPDLNAIVLQKNELTPRLMILRVAADGWDLPDFDAGQYVVLGLPPSAARSPLSVPEQSPPDENKLIRRAYSIASSSVQKKYLEFYINMVSDGAMTPRLFNLKVGDRLWLSSRVTGMFTLANIPPDINIILIATGTGLAPYMSMLTTHLECGGTRQVAILHGAFNSWDLGYRSELTMIQHMCNNFTYLATIDRPEDEIVPWQEHTGWVQDLLAQGEVEKAWGFRPTPENTHVFLCGNPGMIEASIKLLEAQGFKEHSRKSPGQIHVERY
jgi:ferredoxin--NADP+ reductase